MSCFIVQLQILRISDTCKIIQETSPFCTAISKRARRWRDAKVKAARTQGVRQAPKCMEANVRA
eukprot:5272788-Pleurochrysis_carterae.AAC.2